MLYIYTIEYKLIGNVLIALDMTFWWPFENHCKMKWLPSINKAFIIILWCILFNIKGMEHVPNIFMSFDKYLFLEVINILI